MFYFFLKNEQLEHAFHYMWHESTIQMQPNNSAFQNWQ